MALATVTFWGENTNSHGIPQTFYTYLISVYVNQAIGMRDKIVKIVPLTEETPKPARELPFMVKNSDAKNAFIEAFKVLDTMESLKGLKSHKSVVELEKQYSLAVAVR
ncbi:MAG: hypothetical protein HXY48_02620 [Ignavibacteriaceae bacterium]|jgi:hypothetical protein|nr:hypothetical protein [Ignavibacteriaceae bacterium]